MPTTRRYESSKLFEAPKMRAKQRGVATVLIVLLVGMSLSAAVLGVMYYLRSAQSQLLSEHTQTQAQMRAWTGAEAVRLYLAEVQKNGQLATLAGNIGTGTPINITGLTGVSAKFVRVDDLTAPTKFTAEITGVAAEGNSGESKSMLEVVFAIGNGSGSSKDPADGASPPNPNVITFKRNLRLSGGISVEADESLGPISINIDGDLSTSGNSITGVKILNSTGSVSIGSGSSFDEINANCDIQLTGAVSSKVINARRNVCLINGSPGGSVAINANGSVRVESTYDYNGAIAAIGNPTDVGSCRASGSSEDSSQSLAATCAVPNTQYVVDLDFGSAGAKSVKTKGSVILAYGHIGRVDAEGGLTVNWNAVVDSGVVGGKITSPDSGFSQKNPKVVVEPGTSVMIPAVSRVTMTSYVIDAYDYKSVANYVFTIDANGYKKVTVRSVNGIADGDYFLGWFVDTNNGKLDYLCSSLDASNTNVDSPHCNEDLKHSAKTICEGFSPQNSCFSYDKSKKQWNINGKSIAPGIAWFDGSLNVGSGIYYNTFVVTENVTTSGDDNIYAPNYAGYSGSVDGKQYAPKGICLNSSFPGLYPKQFCDVPKQEYLADALSGIGNFVFIAGSVKNGKYTGKDSYVGGNISTGAKTELFGSVKAGNEFTSSGETTIHGFMTAMASGGVVNNSMGAKTTMKLKDLPPTFTPGGLPNKSGTTPETSGSSSTSGSPGVLIRWARYL